MPSVFKLTADMKRVITEQRLAFVVTVCPDGTPNLSPKGTIAVWDDDHLVFADIRSPGTVANLKKSPAVEINVVDPFARKATGSRASVKGSWKVSCFKKSRAFTEADWWTRPGTRWNPE